MNRHHIEFGLHREHRLLRFETPADDPCIGSDCVLETFLVDTKIAYEENVMFRCFMWLSESQSLGFLKVTNNLYLTV